MGTYLYKLSADAVMVLHILFSLFVMFGGILVLLRYEFLFLHIPMVLWAIYVNVRRRTCPLTPMEQHLRKLHGESAYQEGFIAHYLGKRLFPKGVPEQMELYVGLFILFWNILIYIIVAEASRVFSLS